MRRRQLPAATAAAVAVTPLAASALALAESATLMSMPGRVCSNGIPAPTRDPAWTAFVQEVRDASLQAYAAAKTKDQDRMAAVA